MKRKYIQNHNPVSFSFKPTREDFIVDEIPLYEAGKSGNYVHLHIKKTDMSTLELIAILEEQTKFHDALVSISESNICSNENLLLWLLFVN